MNGVEPQRECPRWDRCSVNSCPLDPFQDEHLPHPLDKEQTCPMEKGVRSRIGSKYPDLLPRLGLTPREWARHKVYASLTTAQKEALAEQLKAARAKSPIAKRAQIPPSQ